jgi:hypothetical protein
MRTRTAATIFAVFLFAALTTRAVDWSTNLPCFHGGSYDGWDRDVMTEAQGLGGASVSLSSGTNQTFAWTEANPALATLTLWAEDPAGTITNDGTIRVSMPDGSGCRFDTGVSVTYGGDANDEGKVGGAAFSGDGRTLEIAVTGDFVADDTLTVSGLKLVDLALCPAGSYYLELDFTGDGVTDVSDDYAMTVTVTWPGGSYDGWDRDVMTEFATLEYGSVGTVLILR